jgi:hypothetical protein
VTDWNNDDSDIIKALERSKPDILNFVSKEFSSQSIHYKFLDYIDIDKKDQREGIVMADLSCLEKAWAKYAGARGINETISVSDDTEATKNRPLRRERQQKQRRSLEEGKGQEGTPFWYERKHSS